MKVFEKFITESDETKEDVIEYCILNGLTPCVLNDENEWISEYEIQLLCDNTGDCEKCLEIFLDLEAKNKKEIEHRLKIEIEEV